MKILVLFVAMSMASGLAMAAAGGDKVQSKILYDEAGNTIGTVIDIPSGCEAVPVYAGATQSVIVLCEEKD
jgi:hypothetical protein